MKKFVSLVLILAIAIIATPVCGARGRQYVPLAFTKAAATGAWANYQMVVNGSESSYSVGFPAQITCQDPTSSCTMQFVAPTKAGDTLYFNLLTYNGSAVYISSLYTCATLSSGVCSSSNAIDTATLSGTHAWSVQNGSNDFMDQAYVLSGAGGANYATVNMSASSTEGNYFFFREATPPAGTTVSLDNYFTTYSSSCTSCTGTLNSGSYTLAGGDWVTAGVDSNGALYGFNSPWVIDRQGCLSIFNVASGAMNTSTFTQVGGGYFTFAGMAFKASSYTVSPSNIFTVVNPYPNNGSDTDYSAYPDVSCSPSCTLTLSEQPAHGDLLYMQAELYNSSTPGVISSASINGSSLTVPSGSNTCQLSESGVNDISCAYLLSAPSSAGTSLSVTMSVTGTFDFRVYDVSRSSGSFALDAQNSIYTSTAANPAIGPSVTLGGATDIIFVHAIFTTPAYPFNSPAYVASLYYWLPAGVENFHGTGGAGGTTNGWSEVLPNSTNGNASKFLFCAESGSGPCPATSGSAILANIVAFK